MSKGKATFILEEAIPTEVPLPACSLTNTRPQSCYTGGKNPPTEKSHPTEALPKHTLKIQSRNQWQLKVLIIMGCLTISFRSSSSASYHFAESAPAIPFPSWHEIPQLFVFSQQLQGKKKGESSQIQQVITEICWFFNPQTLEGPGNKISFSTDRTKPRILLINNTALQESSTSNPWQKSSFCPPPPTPQLLGILV